MAETYRADPPEQNLLLPPSLRNWLLETHLVYFVSDLIDQPDLNHSEVVDAGLSQPFDKIPHRLKTTIAFLRDV